MVIKRSVYDSEGKSLIKLVQYDRDVYIYIKDSHLGQAFPVHFYNTGAKEALVVDSAVYENGILSVKIPNILLEECKTITGFVYVSIDRGERSIIRFDIDVIPRAKPGDWIEPESDDYVSIVKLKQDVLDALANAVEDSVGRIGEIVDQYMEEHPVSSPVQSVNDMTGNVHLTAEDVGALPDDTVIPPAYDDTDIRNELGKKTDKVLLEYDGTHILKPNGSRLQFDELYSMLMELPDFVVLVHNNRAYHPNQVSSEQVVFVATYPSNGYIQSERITMLASGTVTTTFGIAEKTSSRVNAITDLNKNDTEKYPSVKAAREYTDAGDKYSIYYEDGDEDPEYDEYVLYDEYSVAVSDINTKIAKESNDRVADSNAIKADLKQIGQLLPDSAPTVGKTLKVLAVNPDGTFTCEWADESSFRFEAWYNETTFDTILSAINDGKAVTLKRWTDQSKGRFVSLNIQQVYPDFAVLFCGFDADNMYVARVLKSGSSWTLTTYPRSGVTDSQILARTEDYRYITPKNVVNAVNSVLCSTAANEQLTAEQQIAAKQRLGIYGNYEEYYLHDTLSADAPLEINLPNVSELHCFIRLEAGATVGNYGQAYFYDSNGVNRGFMTELGNIATGFETLRVGYFNYGIIGDMVQQLRWDATGSTGSLTVKNGRIGDVARKTLSFRDMLISKIKMPPITGEAYIRILYR